MSEIIVAYSASLLGDADGGVVAILNYSIGSITKTFLRWYTKPNFSNFLVIRIKSKIKGFPAPDSPPAKKMI